MNNYIYIYIFIFHHFPYLYLHNLLQMTPVANLPGILEVLVTLMTLVWVEP